MRCRAVRYLTTAVAALTAMLTFSGCSGGAGGSPDILPHLIPSPDSDPVRPISAAAEYKMSEFSGALDAEQYRERVNELYAAVVYDGMKPVFAPDDPVEEIYDAACAVLNRYILNEWHSASDGQYNKVHTVHDWLVCNVEYDFALYDSYRDGATELGNDPAFHIDGVFLNGRAVCDGLSRAFNFLCAVEGIESVRVTGSFSAAPHAWNKVRVDGKWYNVDVTSDAVYYTVGNGTPKKQLSHGYFMLSDETISRFKPNGHVFEQQAFEANDDLMYYSDKTLDIGGKKYSALIKTQAQLNRLFEAVSDADGRVGKIEVMLDFNGKTQVNDADMYAKEISTAYSKLDGADFVFSGASKPYFRYPNGVYMFLMYK